MNKLLLVSIVFCSLARLGTAQDQSQRINLLQSRNVPQGLMPTEYSLIFLLDNHAIVDELVLNESQMAKLNKIKKQNQEKITEYRSQMEAKMQNAVEAGNIDERNGLEAERRERTAALRDDADNLLTKEVLTSKQVKRLSQIRLQAEGSKAFDRSEVRQNLALSEEQISEIGLIKLDGVKLLQESAYMTKGSRKNVPNKADEKEKKSYQEAVNKTVDNMAVARSKTMRAIEQTLLKSQRVKYQEMIGEPFDFLGAFKQQQKEQDAKSAKGQ